MLGVMFAKKITLVPGRTLRVFRNEITAQKNEARELRGSIEVQAGLVHVVLGLVVSGLLPFPKNGRRVDLGMARFETRRRHGRRDSLPGERILIAANKDNLVGHWIQAFDQIHMLGRLLDYGVQ